MPKYANDEERRAAKAKRERERRKRETPRQRAERLQRRAAKRQASAPRPRKSGQPSSTLSEPEPKTPRPPAEDYPLWAIEHEPTEAEMRAVMSNEAHLLNDGSIGLCDRPLCPCRRHAEQRNAQAQARQARVDTRIREIEAAA